MKYSFVIPCYRSENTIISVIDEINLRMKEMFETQYEIIAVNDCSPDNVYNVLTDIAKNNKRVKVVNLAKNVGKHAAMMAGFSKVKGDIIVNVDDDGQCPLDKLKELVEPLNKYDISIARYPKKEQSMLKNMGSKLNAMMATYFISKPRELYLSNFSAMRRYVVEEICRYSNPYPYIDGLFIRTTSAIINVDMEERNRVCGAGNYTLKKSIALFVNGFTAFSVKPLRLATICGCIVALIGFIFGIYTVINKIVNPDIAIGYSSLMAALLFIGGMVMIMLGLIGEYIGRIYICLNQSPQYVIRNTINFNESND